MKWNFFAGYYSLMLNILLWEILEWIIYFYNLYGGNKIWNEIMPWILLKVWVYY